MAQNERLTIEQLDHLDAIMQTSSANLSSSWMEYFFYYVQVLLPHKHMSAPFACVLMIVSFGQLVGVSISSATRLSDSYPLDGTLLDLCQKSTIYPILADYPSTQLYVAVLYITMSLMLILILMGIWSFVFPGGNVASLLRLAIPVIYWVGVIPVTLILLSVWDCSGTYHPLDSSLRCWDTDHIVHMTVAAVFSAIWIGAIVPTQTFLMSYADSYHDNALAHFSWYFETNFMIVRVLICILEAVGVSSATLYFLIGIVLVTLAYLFSFASNSFSYYNRGIAIMFSSCVLGTAAVCSINLIFDFASKFKIETLEGGSSLFFIVLVISYLISVKLRRSRTKDLLSTQVHDSPEDLDAFIMIYSYTKIWKYYIEDVDDTALEGFIALHRKQCHAPECPLCNPRPDFDEAATQRHFLAFLLTDRRNKDVADIRSMLQISRVHLFLLGNPRVSYAKLMEAATMDPSINMQFLIFITKMDIITFVESQKRTVYNKGGSNYTKVMELETILGRMRRTVAEATERRLAFWNQLSSSLPALNILRDEGYAFLELNWKIRSYWNAASAISPTHTKCLELYFPYLMYVLGEPDEAESLQERVEHKPNFGEWREIDMFGDKTASILISGNESDAGRIIKASLKSKDVFGFTPEELIGRSLSILMPEAIGRFHTTVLHKDFKGLTDKKAGGRAVESFGMNNAGYVFPLKVAQQQVCTFRLGMAYVGVMQMDAGAEVHDYMITDMNGKIEGISKSLGDMMGIKPSMINSEGLPIQLLCEQLRFNSPGEYEDLGGAVQLAFNIPRDLRRMMSNGAFKSLCNHLSRIASPRNGPPRLEKRPSMMDINSDQDSIHVNARCEVSTLVYAAGALKIKVFQFPKMEAGRSGEEKPKEDEVKVRVNIMKDMLGGVPNIKKGRRGSLMMSRRAQIKLQAKVQSEERKKDQSKDGDKLHSFMHLLTDAKQPLNFIKRILERYKKPAAALTTVPAAVPPPQLDISRGDADEITPLTSQPQPQNAAANIQPQSKRKALMDTISTMMSGKTMFKALKQFRSMRFEDFYPRSIFRLNWMGRFFLLTLFVLIAVRSMFGVYYTRRLRMFPSLLIYNNDRLTAIVKISRSLIHLLLLQPDSSGNTTISLSARSGFDYNEFKNAAETRNLTNFKEYTTSNLRISTPTLRSSEEVISQYKDSFKAAQLTQIDNGNMSIVYTSTGNVIDKKYYLSTKGAVITVVDHCLKLLNMVETGANLTESDFSAMFAKEATTNELLQGVSYSIVGMMDSCTVISKVHESISLGIFIVVGCVLGVFVIVLFPFLTVVNNDLARSLRVLLGIRKEDVQCQLNRLRCFADYTAKGDSVREKFEEGNTADIQPPAATEQSEKPTSETRKTERFVPYQGNQLSVIFCIILLCGSLIGLYLGLDKVIDGIVSNLLIQLEEIARYSRLISGNAAFIGNIYQYIMTQRNGFCNGAACYAMLSYTVTVRLGQITDFVTGHKYNTTVFSTTYNNLFHDFVEDNPCKTSLFKGRTNCTTFMNGIFTHGISAANIALYDYGASIYNDYSLANNNTASVSKFINDERLINVEMLHDAWLEPAYNYIMLKLRDLVLDKLESSVSIILLFFGGFVLIFIAGFFGWRLLIRSMSRSIFDAKVILANLPPEVIQKNKPLYDFLNVNKLR